MGSNVLWSEYDFSRPFFNQFRSLFEDVPHPNLIQRNCINSEYANYALNQKNTYLVGGGETAEDSAYLFGSNIRIRNCFDTYRVGDTEFSYEIVDCEKSSHIYFSQNCVACSNSVFLYDCRNCQNCFGCVGLRNKQYYIFNKPYPKEEYEKEVKELRMGSRQSINRIKDEFEKLKLKIPRKFAWIIKSENVVGDDIMNSRNCHHCFNARNNIENCKYSYRLFENTKDGYDAFVVWNNTELFYEVFSVSGQNVIGSALIWGGFNIRYSYNCFDCNNIFGCVGLRNKQYCFFNKQYTKDEYEVLVGKAEKHMREMPYIDAMGRKYGYGEFFPSEIAPFSYNESVAQGYFPKTKDQALQLGFAWREEEERDYKITKQQEEIPDDIEGVPNNFTEEIIECAHKGRCDDHCATVFRVIPQELEFLKNVGLPLPVLCPICRRAERVKSRNPLKLWHRQCMCDYQVFQNTTKHTHHETGKCPNEFETSYSPDRKEIVYCEQCYQAEVV